jgi:hypothetical protein
MSKKNDFKKIGIIIAALLVLLAIITIKDKKHGERSFKAYVVKVDTSKVDNIIIMPKNSNKKITITKSNSVWMIEIKNKKVQADDGTIGDLLSQTAKMKTKSVAATSKNKWKDYEVTDSAGTRIIMKNGDKKLTDFIMGKFSYSQPQGGNPYMRQNVVMTSYVRPYGENTVYAVDGYASMLFNRTTDAFRENAVVVGKSEKWNKIVFNYPADSSFTLIKQNNKWMVNGIVADSNAIKKYFSKIQMLTDNGFNDGFAVDEKNIPALSVSIEGDNITPIVVKAYNSDEERKLVFISSINKGNIFASDKIRKTLFVGKGQFLLK